MSPQPAATPDLVRQLPSPATVHAHIGQLLRELRLARRLYALSKAAEEHRQQAGRGGRAALQK